MTRTRALLLTGLVSVLSIAHPVPEASPGTGIQTLPVVSVVKITPRASAAPLIHKAATTREEQRKTKNEKRTGETKLLPVVNQPDIRADDRELLNDTLMWLPASCRDNLRYLVMRYTKNAERGQSTSSVMLIRGNMTARETAAIVAHECGHIVSLSALRGTPRDGVSAFPDGSIPTYNGPAAAFYSISWTSTARRRSDARNEDFVSGYALEDPFEDFAESFVMYALENAEFRRIAQNNTALARKYAFMENNVFGKSFEPAPSVPLYRGSQRAWDITKLPHRLTL